MKLVEADKIALDDSVKRFLPTAPEAWRPISVRHLAAHTSGLGEVDTAFPYLAEGIADILLPPLKMPATIADTEPAVTARLQTVLTRAAEEKVDPATIAEAARAKVTIARLELVDERKADGPWRRKYRVMFGRMARYWRFELTPEGLVLDLRPTSE